MKRLGIVVFVCLIVIVSAFHSIGSYRQSDPAVARGRVSGDSTPPAGLVFSPEEVAAVGDGSADTVGHRIGVRYRMPDSSVDHSWFFFLGFVVLVVLLRDGPGNDGDVPPSGF